MENRSWKLFILCCLLTGPLRVKTSENLIDSHAIQGTVHSIDKKRQELIPYPRMGRSSFSKSQELSPLEILQKQLIEKNKENQQYLSNNGKENTDEDNESEVQEYSGSEYLLPYPRPGRYLDQKNDDADPENILPYPRFGKSYGSQNENVNFVKLAKEIAKPNNRVEDFDEFEQFITPYPRIGKRTQDGMLEQGIINDGEALPSQNYVYKMIYSKRNNGSGFLTPYPRFGRNDEFLTPYPRLGRSDEFITPYPRLGRNEEFLTPYPRLGRNSEDFITPYPRLGRNEEFLTPYPRLGRNEELLTPYPRFGKSEEFLTPYPRLGRSEEFLTPYPRLGRSEEFLTPYPRLGRSEEFLTPYPRLGRNDQYITPYPRLGKRSSDDILLPYPRIGRKRALQLSVPQLKNSVLDTLSDPTNSLLQYPRMERSGNDDKKQNNTNSNNVQYDEEEDTITMIPNFRFGRSLHKGLDVRKKRNVESNVENHILLPYPRLGRSPKNTYYDNRNMNYKHVPYKRLESSNKLSYFKLPKEGELKNKAHNTKISKQNGDKEISYSEYYIIPYPRPGKRNS